MYGYLLVTRAAYSICDYFKFDVDLGNLEIHI